MKKAQEKVITALKEHKELTMKELQIITNYSNSGLRGRISELRKLGYKIEVEERPAKKYVYKGQTNDMVKRIECILINRNLFDKIIEITELSKIMKTTPAAVENAIAKLYSRYNIMQLTNNKIIVKKLETLK